MAKDVIDLLGLQPVVTVKDNKVNYSHYDISKDVKQFHVFISVAKNKTWHEMFIEFKASKELLVKIICYNTKLFIEQIKSIEKELDIKLIKED